MGCFAVMVNHQVMGLVVQAVKRHLVKRSLQRQLNNQILDYEE